MTVWSSANVRSSSRRFTCRSRYRELVEKANEIGNLVAGHRVTREVLDLFARGHGAFDGNDARAHQLTQDVVGNADHADIVHCRIRAELGPPLRADGDATSRPSRDRRSSPATVRLNVVRSQRLRDAMEAVRVRPRRRTSREMDRISTAQDRFATGDPRSDAYPSSPVIRDHRWNAGNELITTQG